MLCPRIEAKAVVGLYVLFHPTLHQSDAAKSCPNHGHCSPLLICQRRGAIEAIERRCVPLTGGITELAGPTSLSDMETVVDLLRYGCRLVCSQLEKDVQTRLGVRLHN